MGGSRGRHSLSSQWYEPIGTCNTIRGSYGRKAKRAEYARGLQRQVFAKGHPRGKGLWVPVAYYTYRAGRWD